MIETEFVSDVERDDLAEAWDEITGRGGCPGVFSSRPWVTSWASAFRDQYSPELALVSEDAAPFGVVPLFRRRDGVVTTPVNFVSHRGEVIAIPGREGAALAAALVESRRRGDRLLLRGLPHGSPTRLGVAGASSAAGYVTATRRGRSSPVIDIESDWDAYYASRPRKVTHEWERKIRKLERAGEVSVRLHDDDPDALVDRFADVEDESWKDDVGTSIRGRGMEAFYRDVSRRLRDAGLLRAWSVALNGRMLAFLYGAELDGTYYALKTSFAKDAGSLSPGVCLFRDAVRDVFERGLRRFDFVGQPARWKDEWATGRLEHEDVALYPDDLAGRARAVLEGRVRPAARAMRDRLSGRSGNGSR